jgi:hypothetical protein
LRNVTIREEFTFFTIYLTVFTASFVWRVLHRQKNQYHWRLYIRCHRHAASHPGLFDADEVARIREALEQADWADGKVTAGYQSAKAKHNLQLPEGHPLAKEIGRR